jgi:lipoate-protein ligase A
MTDKEQIYLNMLMQKSPNDLVEYIKSLSDRERKVTIDIMIEYVLDQTEKQITELDEYRLHKKEDYSLAKEYLKRFQLQK